MSRRNANPELENRSLHSITSVAEFLIIYGGYEKSTGSECNDLWSYNKISDIWKRYQTPIEIKDTPLSSSICSVGNLVYIFGGDGFDDHDYRQTNSLVSFNLKNSNWEILYPHTDDYDEQRPPPMCGNLLYHHNGSLYVLGGLHGSMNLDTMYKFCLKSLTWSLISQNGDKPTFDGQLYGTVCNNKIYCFEDQQIVSKKFKEMRIYDFSTNTWTSRITNAKNQHYPDDRIFEAFAFSENHGFMSGGMEPYINTYYSDIWMIDLLTLEWFKLQYSLTRGVFYHRISIVDDCYLYSFGGYSDDGSIDTFESFMVQPPKLYRLCRESIIQSPNLSNNAKSLPVSIMDELKFNYNISSL